MSQRQMLGVAALSISLGMSLAAIFGANLVVALAVTAVGLGLLLL